MRKAFTLIELMVTFALLAVMMTSVGLLLTASLRAAKKGLLTAQAKTEGQYAVDVMGNMLRYAVAKSDCTGNSVTFTPRNGDTLQTIFACGSDNIASKSAEASPRTSNLTSSKVKVSGCSIECSLNSVTIKFNIQQAGTSDLTSETVSTIHFDTNITLRNL